MADRKIIFECVIGSRLYGTSRPDSDEDFSGVFLPSTQDLLSLQRCPSEWSMNEKKSDGPRNSKGDVDRKFYSIQRFFQLAAEGQPGQLELLFAPYNMIVTSSPEWQEILRNKEIFLSRKGVAPFVGFALSQAHKAVIKGETLNLIKSVLEWCNKLTHAVANLPLSEVGRREVHSGESYLNLGPARLRVVTNLQGFNTVEVGGRNYDVNLKTKTFMANLKELESRYGTRARAAAEKGYDLKSLSHAYRLLSEAREFLYYGKITLPRPLVQADFIKKIAKDGLTDDHDYFADLTKQIDVLRQEIEPQSPLPEEPNHKAINQLCVDMLRQHVLG